MLYVYGSMSDSLVRSDIILIPTDSTSMTLEVCFYGLVCIGMARYA